jgi:UDP:flavonoid glycosyltransferase YjiC (YdhE family)/SAM-dependent methyltransferase
MAHRSPDRLRQLYLARGRSSDLRNPTRERIHWLCRHASGRRVLDLGCGGGLVSVLLGREGFEVLGVDIDEQGIEEARRALADEAAPVRERVDYLVADLVTFGHERDDLGRSFDTVVLGQVLGTFVRPEAVVAQAASLVAPGGRLVVSVDFVSESAELKTGGGRGFFLGELMTVLLPHMAVEQVEITPEFVLVSGTTPREAGSGSGPRRLAELPTATLERWMALEEQRLEGRIAALAEELDRARRELATERPTPRAEPPSAPAPTRPPAEIATLEARIETLSDARRNLEIDHARLREQAVRLERRNTWLESRLRQSVSLSSIRYRVGTAFFDASRSAQAAVKLPWTLFRLFQRHRRQASRGTGKGDDVGGFGKGPPKADGTPIGEMFETAGNLSAATEQLDNVVVFLAINGGGLGHLTRCLAVARKLRRRSPSTRIVFFTTSSALKVIEDFGFEAYYFPPKVFRPDQTVTDWNAYFARSLEDLLSVYHPSVLVFDGVAPYWSIVEVLERHPEIGAVWMSRGNWKEPADRLERLDRFEHLFDRLVLPGEALAPEDPLDVPYAERVVAVAPILLLDRWDLEPRERAAADLGLPVDGVNVLIQLGAGNINDLEGPVVRTVAAVRRVHPDARLVVAESLIARSRQVVPDGVSVVKEYPLSRYLRAFDLLVSASGYNSFSEAVAFGVPTIFLPNATAITDDQVSRAQRAEDAGVAVVVHPFDEEELEAAVRRLTRPEVADEIERLSRRLVPASGADTAAEAVAALLPERFLVTAPLVQLAERVRAGRGSTAERKPLRVAAVLDEFSFRCFAPEADMVNLHARRWADQLNRHQPQLLLVESVFRGVEGSWRHRLESSTDDQTVAELVAACRERQIPTVFWNKDDPPHFETFLETARLFDVVFTSATSCVPRYRQALGHERVFALPFAAQPRIHNPIGSRGKTADVGFAGSWHDKYADRRRQMDYVLRPAFPYGLRIFDRMHGENRASRQFPEIFTPYVEGGLPYEQLVELYKHFRLFLNVNSVTDDPTMCARRVFEILASGTSVLSGPATAIRHLLGGLVAVSSDETATRKYLSELFESTEHRERLEHRAVREVLTRHTYLARFRRILGSVGLEAPDERQTEGLAAVILSASADGVALHRAALERQTKAPDELFVVLGPETEPALADEWRRQLAALPSLNERTTVVEAWRGDDQELGAHLLELSTADRWAVLSDGHAYGRHYLEDLVLAADYSFAEVVGKAVYHALVVGDLERRRLAHGVEELQYGSEVLLATALLDRAVVERVGLPAEPVGDRTTGSLGVDPGEFFVYVADRFSYVRLVADGTGAESVEAVLDRVEVDDRVLWPVAAEEPAVSTDDAP